MHSTHSTNSDRRPSVHATGDLTFIEQHSVNSLLSLPITHTIYSICESQIYNQSNGEMRIDDIIMDYDSSHEAESGYEEENNENYDNYKSCETSETNDPDFAKFVSDFCQIESQGFGLIPSLRNTYYYNCLNACAVSHYNNHMEPSSQIIGSTIHSWIMKKLLNKGNKSEIIPILEEPLWALADGIMTQLRKIDSSAFHGLSRVLISVRAGHVYLLHMIGDEIIMPSHDKNFLQQFPLFVDIAIKVQNENPHVARRNSCQVFVAVEHAKFKGQNYGCTSNTPYKTPDNSRRQHFLSFNTRMINTPSVEGQ
ncbi:15310_t:CDS:2 [Cetraspora pellucida]|uniref:15310_t:CDS:1 n=1 Tax=Cetraspora pellucida TaxID=1433469 RepID=A0A9N9GXN1_9GLOM|nr:15310_t:CDS:2 [Cetraspora pellucida]